MVKHTDILDALKDRNQWESRLNTWYSMRHDGLRRRNKPWPNAADMHFPLADMLIEKLKPTYVAQIFATDTVASFVAMKQEWTAHQNSCGYFYDYQLKQRSNFEPEMMVAIDTMLQNAKCIVKTYWDARGKRLRFEAINPRHLIVPSWTAALTEADWVVHVQHYSKAAYKRLNPENTEGGFKTDDTTIELISGGEETESGDSGEQQRYSREGITKPGAGTEVVIWELCYRKPDGKWWVKTYSPNKPDLALRPEFGLPYNKGVFSEEQPPHPYGEFNSETKERGYYSPRGVCERVMPHEVSLCKDWNTMKDYQTLTCSPVFGAEGVPQNANLRMVPGQILPFKLTAVQFPPIPVDLPNSMMATRSIAEQLVALPDAGVGRQTMEGQKPKTAAEVNLLGSLAGRNDDLRSRVFRRELAHLLNLAWGILLQYAEADLSYFSGEEMMDLPKEALSGSYRIEPNGSGDNFNRQLVLQRAVARKQLFVNNPNINQQELDKSVLEADDPRLVKRLLLNQGTQQAQQIEDQAQEISIMLLGFPPEVRNTDDDWAHIQSCVGFVQRRAKMGEPMSPEFFKLLGGHVSQHLAALQKKNKPLFQQKAPSVQAFLREIQAQSQPQQQPGAGGQPADNVVPIGGQPADSMQATMQEAVAAGGVA